MIWQLALVIFFSGSLVTLGSIAARLFQVQTSLPEKFIAGMGVWSFYPIVLHFMGAMGPEALVLPLLLLWPFAIRDLRESINHSMPSRGFIGFWCLSAAGFLWAVLAVTVLPTGMDALSYHLGTPAQYLARGSLTPPDSFPYYHFLQLQEMTTLSFVAADPGGIAANIFGLIAILLIVSVIPGLSSGPDSPAAQAIAAALLLSAPITHVILAQTKNDLFAAAAAMIAVRALMRNAEGVSAAKAVAWSGWIAGCAVAIKPVTLCVVAPALLWASFKIRRAPQISTMALVFILPSFFWIARNLRSGFLLVDDTAPGIGIPLGVDRFTHLFSSFFEHHAFYIEGPFGPLLLLSLLIALAPLKYERHRIFQGICLAGLVLWFIAGRGQARFLLPVMILSLVPAAIVIGRAGRIAKAIVVIAAMLSLGTSIRNTESTHRLLHYHSGAIDRGTYMGRWVNSYTIQSTGAQLLPDTANIISIGDKRLFHLHRRAIFDDWWKPSRVFLMAHETHDASALHDSLAEQGFSHVLYNKPGLTDNLSFIGRPKGACERDEAIVEEMLRSHCRPAIIDPDRPGVGLYAL